MLLLWDINYEYIKSHLKNFWSFEYFFDYNNPPNDIDFIIIRWSNFTLDKNYLSKFKSLKAIFQLGIWLDNIDLNYCKNLWIQVINNTSASIYSVSELAIWMLIMGIRNACLLNKKLSNWAYSRDPIWYNLEGMKIWIMWYWRIWKQTTRLLNSWRAFVNFDILVYDIFKDSYDDYLKENSIKFFTELDKFKKNIDYIIIHIPGSENNINLINKKFLENTNIKWIINLSRKCIVNENDILNLLNTNKLDFYISDVVCWEPNIEEINKELLNHERVIILPHIWANTHQVQKRLLDDFLFTFKNFI